MEISCTVNLAEFDLFWVNDVTYGLRYFHGKTHAWQNSFVNRNQLHARNLGSTINYIGDVTYAFGPSLHRKQFPAMPVNESLYCPINRSRSRKTVHQGNVKRSRN